MKYQNMSQDTFRTKLIYFYLHFWLDILEYQIIISS